jgi:hypothetical protein
MSRQRRPLPQGEAPEVDAPAAAEETSETPPVQAAPAPEVDAPAAAEPQPPTGATGFVRCRAIKTCLVRGMPAFEGEVFYLEPEAAERLAGKGSLEIL